MKGWLVFLGNRRPGSLQTRDRYNEAVSRPPAAPVAHDVGPDVDGTPLGRSRERRGRERCPGRHRAD